MALIARDRRREKRRGGGRERERARERVVCDESFELNDMARDIASVFVRLYQSGKYAEQILRQRLRS